MNKHIELVKKWLDDPSSVTTEELRDNRDSALDAKVKAFANHTAYYNAAYNSAYYAYIASNLYWNGIDIAADYVKKYEELTEEKDNE